MGAAGGCTTKDDGLQKGEFNPGAALKLLSGEMAFGGDNGFSMFFPNKLKEIIHWSSNLRFLEQAISEQADGETYTLVSNILRSIYQSGFSLGLLPISNVTGEGLENLRTLATEILPNEISVDYAGESRQYIEEGGGLIITFFFAIIGITT